MLQFFLMVILIVFGLGAIDFGVRKREFGSKKRYYIAKIRQNILKSPGDLRRLPITKIQGKDHMSELMWSTWKVENNRWWWQTNNCTNKMYLCFQKYSTIYIYRSIDRSAKEFECGILVCISYKFKKNPISIKTVFTIKAMNHY